MRVGIRVERMPIWLWRRSLSSQSQLEVEYVHTRNEIQCEVRDQFVVLLLDVYFIVLPLLYRILCSFVHNAIKCSYNVVYC